MSTRYGLGLALEPGFTSRAYRARQLICGQYASWAAEMHMVYLALAGYFECADSAVAELDAGLARIADRSREDAAQFPLSHQGVRSWSGAGGHIFLEFGGPNQPAALGRLQNLAADLLARTPEVVLGPPVLEEKDYCPRLPLMQFARLPSPVFDDAVEFARAVVDDLQIPASTRAWRLLLIRFQSEAAGQDWQSGSWAMDLRWELLASYPL